MGDAQIGVLPSRSHAARRSGLPPRQNVGCPNGKDVPRTGDSTLPGSYSYAVRIIAGSRKGSTIYAPKSEARPTGDRVREAAFNLIGPVDDMAVLDLFAGSGAMGLEALSRGASSAVFVESDREAQRT